MKDLGFWLGLALSIPLSIPCKFRHSRCRSPFIEGVKEVAGSTATKNCK